MEVKTTGSNQADLSRSASEQQKQPSSGETVDVAYDRYLRTVSLPVRIKYYRLSMA